VSRRARQLPLASNCAPKPGGECSLPESFPQLFQHARKASISGSASPSVSQSSADYEANHRIPEPPGKTFLKYSPNGKRLIVAGCANFARSFNTGDLGEPDIIHDTHDDTYAAAAGVGHKSKAHALRLTRSAERLFHTWSRRWNGVPI
jgi:hypothetical protein